MRPEAVQRGIKKGSKCDQSVQRGIKIRSICDQCQYREGLRREVDVTSVSAERD